MGEGEQYKAKNVINGHSHCLVRIYPKKNKVGFVVSLSGWFVVCVIVSVDNERNIEVS